MNVIMICLGAAEDCIGEENEAAKLLRLLSVVVSEELTPVQKLHILQEEYHIEVTRKLEDEVNYMCNWSEGIIERALAKANAHAAKYVEEHMVEVYQLRAEVEQAQAELEQAQAEVASREQRLEEQVEQSFSHGEILGTIGAYLELGIAEAMIISRVMEKFSVLREDAEMYLAQKRQAIYP